MEPQDPSTPESPAEGIVAGDEAVKFTLEDQGRVVAIHGVSRSVLSSRDEVAEAMCAFLAANDYGERVS